MSDRQRKRKEVKHFHSTGLCLKLRNPASRIIAVHVMTLSGLTMDMDSGRLALLVVALGRWIYKSRDEARQLSSVDTRKGF